MKLYEALVTLAQTIGCHEWVFSNSNFLELERIKVLEQIGEFEQLKSLENEEIEVRKFESFEFESGREFGA